jgi:hypothetical protein
MSTGFIRPWISWNIFLGKNVSPGEPSVKCPGLFFGPLEYPGNILCSYNMGDFPSGAKTPGKSRKIV